MLRWPEQEEARARAIFAEAAAGEGVPGDAGWTRMDSEALKRQKQLAEEAYDDPQRFVLGQLVAEGRLSPHHPAARQYLDKMAPARYPGPYAYPLSEAERKYGPAFDDWPAPPEDSSRLAPRRSRDRALARPLK
jgi:hypothetical protein